jgi:hypothetical protein
MVEENLFPRCQTFRKTQGQLTAMPTPENETAPTGFRWRWLLCPGAVFGLGCCQGR